MASAAEPVLASVLWTSLHAAGEDGKLRNPRLATGQRELDAALNGGLDYGSTVGISVGADNETQNFIPGLIANHLLSSEAASVIAIHSTLSFDVKRLHAHLKATCETRRAASEAASEALAMLDRVRIMKVFDFVGLTESVSELRGDLGRVNNGPLTEDTEGPRAINLPASTIADSQADEEDEVLADAPVLTDHPAAPTMQRPLSARSDLRHNDTEHLLIIDNIAHLISPLLRNNHIQGQALLASFMRSLHHLTKEHQLCTVLINDTLSRLKTWQEESPSIFSSCALRPTLGKSFSNLLDLHLLVHRIPKSAADARAMYGEQQVQRRVEMATVVEVLQDRFSDRIGKWAVIDP